MGLSVGIVQLDGNLPNIALMKIASFHREKRDCVEWWNGPLFPYTKVFASKIFKFTEDNLPSYVVRGGTGYQEAINLPSEIERLNHSGGWFLYPKYKNHIGFSERGCRLNCSFCVVPAKEGKPRKDLSIKDLLSNPKGGDRLVLLDDDFLGHPNNEDVFLEIIDRKLKVCFSQGLNIRLLKDRQAELLKMVNFRNLSFKKKQVTFAWDSIKDKNAIMAGVSRCLGAGIKPYQMQFFVLIGYDSTPDEDMERVEEIRAIGADPFVMAYDRKVAYQRMFQRWVNHKAIFKTVPWGKYAV